MKTAKLLFTRSILRLSVHWCSFQHLSLSLCILSPCLLYSTTGADHSSLGHGSVYTPLLTRLTNRLALLCPRPARPVSAHTGPSSRFVPSLAWRAGVVLGAATNTAKFRHIIWRLSVMRTALILGKCQVNMDSSLSSAELMSVKNVSSMSNT